MMLSEQRVWCVYLTQQPCASAAAARTQPRHEICVVSPTYAMIHHVIYWATENHHHSVGIALAF